MALHQKNNWKKCSIFGCKGLRAPVADWHRAAKAPNRDNGPGIIHWGDEQATSCKNAPCRRTARTPQLETCTTRSEADNDLKPAGYSKEVGMPATTQILRKRNCAGPSIGATSQQYLSVLWCRRLPTNHGAQGYASPQAVNHPHKETRTQPPYPM